MKKTFLILLFVCCGLLENNFLFAQEISDSTELYYFKLKKKKEFFGYILESKRHTTLFNIPGQGNLKILNRKIKYAESLNPDYLIAGEYWPEYKAYFNHTHVPTAFQVKNFAQLGVVTGFTTGTGIGRYVSLSLGLAPLLYGEYAELTYGWISPKVTIPTKAKHVNVAVGYFGGTRFEYFRNNKLIGFPYGVLTIGNKQLNGTIGLGYGMEAGAFMSKPVCFGAAMCGLNKLVFTNIEWMHLGVVGQFTTVSIRKQRTRNTLDLGIYSFVNAEGNGSTDQIFTPFIKLTFTFYKPHKLRYL